MSVCPIIPEGYQSSLDLLQTEIAIKLIKDTFERELAKALNLTRVSAPLFVQKNSGLNDDLNGVERPVAFDIPDADSEVEIVHSLAKWKRMALKRYGFETGKGLYTDMNAIRRDEELDNLHSVYVDQWDWEKVISKEDRTVSYLQDTVKKITGALFETQSVLKKSFPGLEEVFAKNPAFITAQQLEELYPNMTPKERENTAAQEYGCVFIMQIGDKLAGGQSHDGRAPDYDDWSLNGDLLAWYPVLGKAVELTSMGIRVDEKSLREQLIKSGQMKRADLPFHRMLLNGELPLTMGGGIGQSRICMLMLNKAHVGEVQCSVWPDDMIASCAQSSITLL